jgi:hypothetical protein
VRSAYRRVEHDSLSETPKAITKLDIFDLRRPVANFVKAPRLAEIVGANCAESRPEAPGVTAALLMNVVMKQVPVLRLR